MQKFHDVSPQPHRVAPDDVARLIGDTDDGLIAAIMDTGATYAEIEQAIKWAGGGKDEPVLDGEGLSPIGEAVYDILMSDPGFAPDDDR
jgi:hypothetical protein